MNDLIISENMSNEELELIVTQVLQLQIKRVKEELKEVKDELFKLKKEKEIDNENINLKIDKIANEVEKKTEVAINSMRLGNQKYEYVSQNDFGASFRVKIGAQMVGKLFKVIGLAKPSKGRTEPFINLIPTYAISDPIQTQWGEKINYRWHYKNCLRKLEEWLESHGCKEEFYSIDNERKMTRFINELYETYC